MKSKACSDGVFLVMKGGEGEKSSTFMPLLYNYDCFYYVEEEEHLYMSNPYSISVRELPK